MGEANRGSADDVRNDRGQLEYGWGERQRVSQDTLRIARSHLFRYRAQYCW